MSKFEETEISILNAILDEALLPLVHSVCKVSLDELAEKFLCDRPKPPQDNPLLYAVLQLIDDIISLEARAVAIEAIDFIVDEHFALKQCENVFDAVSEELMQELLPPLIPECYMCVEEETVCAALLDEVCTEIVASTTSTEYQSASTAAQEHRNNIELLAVKAIAERTVVRRMLLGHVIMTMITRYEKVLTSYYARGVVHRILANKLLLLVEEIERRVDAPKQNAIISMIFEKLLLGDIQNELISHLINASLDKEGLIDEIESRSVK